MSVCLTCGDKGEVKSLVYCIKCLKYSLHSYCLDEIPKKGEKITWTCDECRPLELAYVPIPVRQSSRIRERMDRFAEVKRKRSKHRRVTPALRELLRAVEEKVHKDVVIEPHSSPGQPVKGEVIEDYGNQELRRPRRRLVLEEQDDSSDESDKIEVTASQSTNDVYHEPLDIYPNWLLESEKQGRHLAHRDGYNSNDGHVQEPVNVREPQPPQFAQQEMLITTHGTSEYEELKTQRKGLVHQDGCHFNGMKAVLDVRASPSAQITCTDQLFRNESIDRVPVQPILNPIWKGCFRIFRGNDEMTADVAAYLPNIASIRVVKEARTLVTVLACDIMPRSEGWPKEFLEFAPTVDDIALYFFPTLDRDEKAYEKLVDYIVEQDVALKATTPGSELLVFSSQELPVQNWRYQRKYYLWGVFRENRDVHRKSMYPKLPEFKMRR